MGAPMDLRVDPVPDFSNTVARTRVANGGTLVGSEQILNFIAGTNGSVTITDDQTNGRINLTLGATTNTEDVQDIVAALLVQGANITLTYDDTANTLTIAVSGLTESVQDIIGALTLGRYGLKTTYDDAGNDITIDVDLAMTDTQPAGSQVIPANYRAYVPGGDYKIASGQGVTVGSGGLLELGSPSPQPTRIIGSTIYTLPAAVASTTSYALVDQDHLNVSFIAPANGHVIVDVGGTPYAQSGTGAGANVTESWALGPVGSQTKALIAMHAYNAGNAFAAFSSLRAMLKFDFYVTPGVATTLYLWHKRTDLAGAGDTSGCDADEYTIHVWSAP